jgi:hypothetical protein
MHSTVTHRHQGATPSRYPDVDHGLGIVPNSAIYDPQTCLDSLVTGVMVWDGHKQRWRHHPATKGSFGIRGDTATWTYNGMTHMAPLSAVGSVTFPWKLPGKKDLQHSNIREKEPGDEVQIEDTDLAPALARGGVMPSCRRAGAGYRRLRS